MEKGICNIGGTDFIRTLKSVRDKASMLLLSTAIKVFISFVSEHFTSADIHKTTIEIWVSFMNQLTTYLNVNMVPKSHIDKS